MKYYQKDAIMDIIYPAHCPVCGQILSAPKRHLRFIPPFQIQPPAMQELICKPCFYRLPFILESHCIVCGRALENPLADRCEDCRRYAHIFSEARAVFSYKGSVQQSLYRLKYQGRKEYSRFFAVAMSHYLSDWIHSHRITAIVPIPLHKSRLKVRNYNQAKEIAVRLGERMNLPVYSDLLIRKKATTAQKNLSRTQRMENLSQAFTLNPKYIDSSRTHGSSSIHSLGCILLVDDIFTTGSTVDAAATVLINAGCPAVFVAAVAVTG